MKKLKAVLEKSLEPDDFVSALTRGYPCLRIAGSGIVCVEGHGGIVLFDEDRIVLDAGKMQIDITGEGLRMPVFSGDYAEIRGKIDGISFERGGKQ